MLVILRAVNPRVVANGFSEHAMRLLLSLSAATKCYLWLHCAAANKHRQDFLMQQVASAEAMLSLF